MNFDLGGFPISRATLRVPRYGIPHADAWLPDDVTSLVEGQRAVLRVGDLDVVGTLFDGGAFGGSQRWTIIGGANAWNKMVAARAYHESANVKLSDAALDLAREVGETREGPPVLAADRSLGVAWTREAGLASEALDAFTLPAGAPRGTPGQWWVDVTGITHLGARPARAFAAPPTLSIPDYDPSNRLASIVLADDAISPLLPGCVLSHPSLPGPLAITSIVVRATPERIEIDALGEKGAAELFADLVASLMAPDRYARLAPMQVQEVQGALASVVPQAGDSRALPIPGSPLLAQIPGVPGCTATLAVGAGVLVAWPAADPASPAIVAYVPGVLPDALTFAATSSIALACDNVSLGGAAGSGAPAVHNLAGVLTNYFAALAVATGVPAPVGFTSAKVKVVP